MTSLTKTTPALIGEVIDPEPERCEECMRTSAQVTREDGAKYACISEDGLGRNVCGACFVPDMTDPNWAGFIGPDTDLDSFRVAPPSAKVVVGSVVVRCGLAVKSRSGGLTSCGLDYRHALDGTRCREVAPTVVG